MVKPPSSITLLLFAISIIFLSGCISSNSNSKEPTLSLTVDNNNNYDVSLKIIIIDSKQLEIYNNTLQINPNDYFSIDDITNTKGIFTINVSLNNLSYINNDIRVEEKYSNVKIQINNDNVEITQIIK